MDVATPPHQDAHEKTDRLAAEVRESALLLLLSVAVTVGLATAGQALLSAIG